MGKKFVDEDSYEFKEFEMSDINDGVLPIVRGGTGAGTADEALLNLGGIKFVELDYNTFPSDMTDGNSSWNAEAWVDPPNPNSGWKLRRAKDFDATDYNMDSFNLFMIQCYSYEVYSYAESARTAHDLSKAFNKTFLIYFGSETLRHDATLIDEYFAGQDYTGDESVYWQKVYRNMSIRRSGTSYQISFGSAYYRKISDTASMFTDIQASDQSIFLYPKRILAAKI